MPVAKKRAWIIAIAMCLLVFVLLAASYSYDWGSASFDNSFGAGLVGRATPTGLVFFGAVTIIGNMTFLIPFSTFIGLVFILKKLWQHLKIFLLAIVVGSLLSTLFKVIFLRPRPAYLDAPHLLRNFSFPSFHAMVSVILFGTLTYLFCPSLKSKAARIVLLIGATVLAMFVGFSRLYLGVHYLSDVIAGFALGAFWLLVILYADQNEVFGAPPIQKLY